MNLFDLSGKTAVIIGGNSTLGSVMAEALGAHGAAVAVVGRNTATCEEVCARIAETNGQAKSFYADATNPEDLKHALIEILAWSGHVDILMNCPGTNSTTPFLT